MMSHLFFLFALGMVRAEQGFDCSAVEGVYHAYSGERVASPSKTLLNKAEKYDVNIVCLEKDRPVANVYLELKLRDLFLLDTSYGLTNAYIQDDQILFSDFGLDREGRKSGSAKSLNVYLKLSLSDLKNGILNGRLMGINFDKIKQLHGQRDDFLPVLKGVGEKFDAQTLTGTYKTSAPFWGNAELVFDVLLGTPVIFYVFEETKSPWRFIDGAEWDESGVFSLGVPQGNGGEPDDKKFVYIRGRFLNQRELEYYLVSPALGLQGPMRAVRSDNNR